MAFFDNIKKLSQRSKSQEEKYDMERPPQQNGIYFTLQNINVQSLHHF